MSPRGEWNSTRMTYVLSFSFSHRVISQRSLIFPSVTFFGTFFRSAVPITRSALGTHPNTHIESMSIADSHKSDIRSMPSVESRFYSLISHIRLNKLCISQKIDLCRRINVARSFFFSKSSERLNYTKQIYHNRFPLVWCSRLVWTNFRFHSILWAFPPHVRTQAHISIYRTHLWAPITAFVDWLNRQATIVSSCVIHRLYGESPGRWSHTLMI